MKRKRSNTRLSDEAVRFRLRTMVKSYIAKFFCLKEVCSTHSVPNDLFLSICYRFRETLEIVPLPLMDTYSTVLGLGALKASFARLFPLSHVFGKVDPHAISERCRLNLVYSREPTIYITVYKTGSVVVQGGNLNSSRLEGINEALDPLYELFVRFKEWKVVYL